MWSQGPSQLWLRSGQCQLLLGLFWACCSSPAWSLLFPMGAELRSPRCGEESGGVHQRLSTHHRSGVA